MLLALKQNAILKPNCHYKKAVHPLSDARYVWFEAGPESGSESLKGKTFTEKMEAKGFEEFQTDLLKDTIQQAFQQAGHQEELTEDQIDTVTSELFGDDLNIPKELESKLKSLEQDNITPETLQEIKAAFASTIDTQKMRHIMLTVLREEVQASATEPGKKSGAERIAKETSRRKGGQTEEAAETDNGSAAESNESSDVGIEVQVDYPKVISELEELGKALERAIESGMDEEQIIDQLMAELELDGTITMLRRLLILPIRPITLALRIKDLADHLTLLKELREHKKARRKQRNNYILVGLAVRKIGQTIRLLRRAENRASYRTLRVRDREKYRDEKMDASGRRWVGSGINKADRDLGRAENHREELGSQLDRTDIRREHTEQMKDIRFDGRENLKQTRFENRMQSARQKRDNLEEKLSVTGEIEEMTASHRNDYKGNVVKGRADFREKNREDRHEAGLERKYNRYNRKVERMENRLQTKQERWNQQLENRARRRRGERGKREKPDLEASTVFQELAGYQGPASEKPQERMRLTDNFDPDNGYRFNTYNPAADKVLEDFKKWEGLMPPEEVDLMQDAQDAIYNHFLNPAFMYFIQGREANLNPIFIMAAENPYDLTYRVVKEGVVEVRKSPNANPDSGIPNNFLIRLEKGNIVRMKAGLVDESLAAENPNDPLPWTDAGEYNKLINDYLARYSEGYWDKAYQKAALEFGKLPPDQQTAENWEKVFGRMFEENVPDVVYQIYEINNKTFIRNLKMLVDARALPMELSHPYYPIIRDFANRTDESSYILMAADHQEGVYLIKQNVDGALVTAAAVSLEGYFMEYTAAGWAVDPLYSDILETQYYATTPRAKELLDADIQYQIDKMGENTEAYLHASKLEIVSRVIPAASIERLKQALVIMAPDTPKAYVDGWHEGDKDTLTEWMVGELMNNPAAYTARQADELIRLFTKTPPPSRPVPSSSAPGTSPSAPAAGPDAPATPARTPEEAGAETEASKMAELQRIQTLLPGASFNQLRQFAATLAEPEHKESYLALPESEENRSYIIDSMGNFMIETAGDITEEKMNELRRIFSEDEGGLPGVEDTP